ncbi:MAG: alpha/beta hydrolase [Solirubrobacterales bacterium]
MPAHAKQPMPEVPGVEHIYLNAGGLRMHVATAGPEGGEPIMLLHGWPQHWWLWRNVIPVLADAGYRVYAPDLRGLGWTEATPRYRDYDKRQFARDIVALLDVLELHEPIKLVGHDWGGWTGFVVAMTHPERVERYLAMNIPPPWLDPRPFNLGRAAKATSRLWYQVVMATPGLNWAAQVGPAKSVFEDGIVKGSVRREVWGDGVLDVFLDQFEDADHRRSSKFIYRRFLLTELPQIQAGKYLDGKLTVKTHLLFGRGDQAIDPDVIDADHSRHADDLTIEFVEDCGHFIVDEQPETVAATALKFFA